MPQGDTTEFTLAKAGPGGENVEHEAILAGHAFDRRSGLGGSQQILKLLRIKRLAAMASVGVGIEK